MSTDSDRPSGWWSSKPGKVETNRQFSQIVAPQVDPGVSGQVSGLVERTSSPGTPAPRLLSKIWKGDKD